MAILVFFGSRWFGISNPFRNVFATGFVPAQFVESIPIFLEHCDRFQNAGATLAAPRLAPRALALPAVCFFLHGRVS